MSEHQENCKLRTLQAKLPCLAAEARERAVEFECARQIAPDYVDKLKAAGTFNILVAKKQGGLGGTLLDWLDMASTLAEADASTGWTTGHGASCNALIANIANQSFAAAFLSDSNALAAWSNLPRVDVARKDEGVHINGRWSFETGCTSATYVGGMFTMPDVPANENANFVALAPVEEAIIERTWDPVGLAGTGSHDVVFEDVYVPHERIFAWPDSMPTYDYPTAIFAPGGWFIAISAAATHLGLARRAIDETRTMLSGKIDRRVGGSLIEKPTNMHVLERSEGILFACRAALETALRNVWSCGLEGQPLDKDLRLQIRLACTTTVHECKAIVRNVYDIAGAGAIVRSSVLQRLYRDASCLGAHVGTSIDTFERIARVRGGLDKDFSRI